MRNTALFFILFFAVVNSAFAERCWQSAAERYGIHTAILRAIAMTESAMNVRAVNRNTNGSVDVGLMQINSRWFPRLAEMGIEPGDLWDGCTNVQVGAWVLAGYIRRFGYNWRAIGAYNAGPSSAPDSELKRINYAQRVFHNLSVSNPPDGMRIRAGFSGD
ncbi:MAG: lytic transglycosylase domain-containing protein [Gammaproteobacteria bacterium]